MKKNGRVPQCLIGVSDYLSEFDDDALRLPLERNKSSFKFCVHCVWLSVQSVWLWKELVGVLFEFSPKGNEMHQEVFLKEREHLLNWFFEICDRFLYRYRSGWYGVDSLSFLGGIARKKNWHAFLKTSSDVGETHFLQIIRLSGPIWPELHTGRMKLSSRLFIGLVKLKQSLTTASAWISTLGGGYYFCRNIKQAWSMASRQLAVATMLGNPVLCCQCRVHQIYLVMQCGYFSMAKQMILKERRFAKRVTNNNPSLVTMLRVAASYLKKIYANRHKIKEARHEDFQRQAFVKNFSS